MKKLLSFILLVSAVVALQAQSYSFTYQGQTFNHRDTLTCNLAAGNRVDMMGLIVNNLSRLDQNVIATFGNVNANGMSVISVCTGVQCVPGNTSGTFTVAPNGSYDELHPTFSIPNTLQPGAEGLFYLLIYDANAEPDTAEGSYIFVKVVVANSNSITSAQVPATFAAYPNPANDNVSIQYAVENASHNDVLIFNTLGTCVKTIALSSNEGSVNVDLSDLSAGVYTYGIRSNGQLSQMQKLIVR